MENNRKAQEELYKRFFRAMMALCARYTNNKSDATEMLNDGFLKVFKNLDRYNAERGSLYTWMRKIMINTAVSFLRQKQVLHDMDVLLDGGEEPGIENEAVQKMSSDELLNLIRQLPPTTRLVFNLYVVDGFDHGEIGEMLQISKGTSRWHLSEARRQLRIIIHLMETTQ